MGEDLLRAFDEEFTLPICCWLEERDRDCLRLSPSDKLLRRSPVGAALVQGIEHYVATAFIVEALDELTGRVIDDGRMAACLDLSKQLHDQGCLAGPGVADNLDVLVFGCPRKRSGSLQSSVLIPIPVPCTALLNCFGVTMTGPFNRRP